MGDSMTKKRPFNIPDHLTYVVWLTVAMNFGALLFFSDNGSIMNPKMPIWPSVLKDGVWLLLVVGCLHASRGSWGNLSLIRLFAPAGGLLFVMALGAFLSEGSGIGIAFVKSLKNALLYMLMPAVVASSWKIDIQKFSDIVYKIISLTLVFSMALYFSIEYGYKPEVPDLRMFGSTGNPNSAALLSALLFTLVSVTYRNIDKKVRGFLILISLCSAYLAASYFYIFWMIMVMVYCSIMRVSQENSEQTQTYWKEVFLYVALAWVVASILVRLTPYDDIPLLLRLHSAIELSQDASLVDSDSVRVRWGALKLLKITGFGAGGPFVQMDSAILTFLQNFGVAGFLFAIYPAIISGFFLARIRFRLIGLDWSQHTFFLVAGLITLSGMVHYQVSHFPSNIILYLLLCFFLREFLDRLQAAPVGKGRPRTLTPAP